MKGTRYEDHAAFSVPANLGKRGIARDVKTEEGAATLRRLLGEANVFIEGFHPGVIARRERRYQLKCFGLIDYVEAYLENLGVASLRVHDDDKDKRKRENFDAVWVLGSWPRKTMRANA